MKKVLVYLALFSLSIWAGIKMQLDQGYMVISYHHTTISMTLWAACLVAIIFLIILRLLVLIWLKKIQLQKWFVTKKQQKLKHKFKILVHKGTTAKTQGKWKQAIKYFEKAYMLEEHSFLNLNLAECRGNITDAKKH